MNAAPSPDSRNLRPRAAERLRRAPDATRAEAYRLSLDGFRKLERSDLAGAEASLTRSVSLDADDPVARYRYGRVLQARRQDAPALAQFELSIRANKTQSGADCGGGVPRSGTSAGARRSPGRSDRLLPSGGHVVRGGS